MMVLLFFSTIIPAPRKPTPDTTWADKKTIDVMGTAIAMDDAGNIVVNTNFPNAPSSEEFIIIPADGSEYKYMKLDMAAAGAIAARFDQLGRIVGDVLSAEGAYMWINPSAGTKVAVIKVAEGAQVADYSMAAEVGAQTTSMLAQPAIFTVEEIDAMYDNEGDVTPSFWLRNRSTAGYVTGWSYNEDDAAWTFDNKVTVATGGASNEGFATFTLQGETYFVVPVVDGSNARSAWMSVVKTDGTVEMVQNPSNLPPQTEIDHIEEPMVKADIMIPKEYVGNIMEICQERRGNMIHMEYITENRVQLHYDMPLNEVIYDFFDALKSRTRGYGSLDYELIGYRPSKLVKLDILLNGDIVDALSFILFADNAYPRARKICEKLKDNIPRAQFEIPVQAAIGGKIIARETIKALRKDVLAKCYGGDITRKKKLLEKQKEGKKRMRTFGTVSVPSEAFMAVLKLDE